MKRFVSYLGDKLMRLGRFLPRLLGYKDMFEEQAFPAFGQTCKLWGYAKKAIYQPATSWPDYVSSDEDKRPFCRFVFPDATAVHAMGQRWKKG